MSVEAMTIIARCTRNGRVQWQNVAQQMGCSIDAVRSRHDPDYLPIRPWPYPCERVEPEPEEDPDDVHSLAVKGPLLRELIGRVLKRHGALSVAAIAGCLGSPAVSVRRCLAKMRIAGWAENDSHGRGNGGAEWTWRLTPDGLEAVTGRAEKGRAAA